MLCPKSYSKYFYSLLCNTFNCSLHFLNDNCFLHDSVLPLVGKRYWYSLYKVEIVFKPHKANEIIKYDFGKHMVHAQ